MQPYQVGFPNEAIQKHFEKELSDLDRSALVRIKQAIEAFGFDPRPPGKKFKFLRPPIEVYQYAANYRLRVGDYRVLYDVDEKEKKVILLSIRRRSEKTYH